MKDGRYLHLEAPVTAEAVRHRVVAPAIHRALVQALYDKGVTFSGDINDRAYRDYVIGRTFGWLPVKDAGIPKTGNDAYRTYFTWIGDGIAFAQQYENQEALRDPNKFGDILRRLVVYGAERSSDDKVLTCQVDDA